MRNDFDSIAQKQSLAPSKKVRRCLSSRRPCSPRYRGSSARILTNSMLSLLCVVSLSPSCALPLWPSPSLSLVPSPQRRGVAWKEPATSVCPQSFVLNDGMATNTVTLRLHLGNECVDGVRPGEVGSEPVLCTAGVGLAFFTVGFCTGTVSSLCLSCRRRILVLDW